MSVKDFIESYKKLENTVSSLEHEPEPSWLSDKFVLPENAGIYDIENACTDNSIKNKLKLCRMIRNYCQHEKDYNSFVTTTPAMVSFMERIALDLESGIMMAKDVMKKITPLKEQNILKDALNIAAKKGYVPIVGDEKKCIAVLSAMDICAILNNGAKTTAKLKNLVKRQKLHSIQQNTPYVEIRNIKNVMVVEDKKGFYRGLIF